jgi:ubiquinone biosynthesis protein
VKVLRAGTERRFARDLSDMAFAARFAESLAPEFQRLRLAQVVETLARSVRMEMDFRLEAAAASEFVENSKDDPEIRAPVVDWNRTTREVMTMEWIDGIPLTDPERLTELGFDPHALARALIQTFLRTALRDGFFHADMHQGNFFVDDEGRIVAVDFGIMGRLGRKERRFLAEILYGFIRRDYMRVAEVHFEAGYVPRAYRVEDFAQALRAIGEPIHSRTADQISMAKLLMLLFEITSLFEMTTRIELVLLCPVRAAFKILREPWPHRRPHDRLPACRRAVPFPLGERQPATGAMAWRGRRTGSVLRRYARRRVGGVSAP